MILPERLKEARKQKKFTQRQLAAKLDVAPSTIALYETGDRKPDPAMLNKLADCLGVSIDWLLGRTDNPSNEEEQPKIDRTEDAIKAIESGDLKKLMEIVERINEFKYDDMVIKNDRKEMVVKLFKDYIIPSWKEQEEFKRERGKHDKKNNPH